MLLPIRQYGDTTLRVKCAAVTEVNDELHELTRDMLETMYDAEGIGLAAPQIGRNIRLVVIDIPANEDDAEAEEMIEVNGEQAPMRSIMPLVFINPTLEPYGKQELGSEGCLSVKGIHANVSRLGRVKAELPQMDGSVLRLDCGGLLARCLQHECDHLDGFLFTDRVSSAAKVTLTKKLRNLALRNAGGY